MEYTPKRIDEDIMSFAVLVTKCPICGKKMVAKPHALLLRARVFPPFWKNNFTAQAKRAGLVFISHVKVDDEFICNECHEKDLASFLCTGCGERKKTSKEKESFGDPPEYLCEDCYNTMPAKKWDELVEKLHNIHRYDFE